MLWSSQPASLASLRPDVWKILVSLCQTSVWVVSYYINLHTLFWVVPLQCLIAVPALSHIATVCLCVILVPTSDLDKHQSASMPTFRQAASWASVWGKEKIVYCFWIFIQHFPVKSAPTVSEFWDSKFQSRKSRAVQTFMFFPCLAIDWCTL